jgi:hypothetical protein
MVWMSDPDSLLEDRIRWAVESILGNERLTDGLDDEPADALLDWGIATAEMVTKSTAGLGGSEAESILSDQMAEVRRLMRYVSVLIQGHRQMSEEDVEKHLERVLKQVEVVYSGMVNPKLHTERLDSLSQYVRSDFNAEDFIVHLRGLLESPHENETPESGEARDEKI